MVVERIVAKRTTTGEKPTIFTGPSTSTTLPSGSTEDVRKEIEYILDVGGDTCALFILPANDVLPDTSVENLLEMHRHARECGD